MNLQVANLVLPISTRSPKPQNPKSYTQNPDRFLPAQKDWQYKLAFPYIFCEVMP